MIKKGIFIAMTNNMSSCWQVGICFFLPTKNCVNFYFQAQVLVQIGPLHDPVTWYGINYTRTQITQWDFQNKGTRTSPARLSFVLKVPLRNLRPSVIYSVPCDRIVQRAYLPASASRRILQINIQRTFFGV